MKKTKNLNYYSKLPYKIELHYEPADNTWVASHPELGKGSCYAIGETKEEAFNLLEEEKIFLLEYAIKEGKEIPEPQSEEVLPSGHFVIRIPKSVHKALKDEAEKENVSLNHLTTTIISGYLGSKQLSNSLLGIQDDISSIIRLGWKHILEKSQYKSTWNTAHISFPKSQKKILEQKSDYGIIYLGDPSVEIKESKETYGWRTFPTGIQKATIQD